MTANEGAEALALHRQFFHVLDLPRTGDIMGIKVKRTIGEFDLDVVVTDFVGSHTGIVMPVLVTVQSHAATRVEVQVSLLKPVENVLDGS